MNPDVMLFDEVSAALEHGSPATFFDDAKDPRSKILDPRSKVLDPRTKDQGIFKSNSLERRCSQTS